MRHICPLTTHFSEEVAKKDYRGKRVAYWGHVVDQMLILYMSALQQAGAEIFIGACNVESTNDAIAAHLAGMGISVFAWKGMTTAEYRDNLAQARAFEADCLCDMGGELSEVYLDKQPPVAGALEATTSGLTRLKQHDLPFPVFDWNSIPLKNNMENRFHVGNEIWPAFSDVTGLGLFGRRVLVIGYGPVGKGIAERARNLGGLPHVADLDPVRLMEARHHGCETVSLQEGLARCDIVVTATGADGVLREEMLRKIRPGAILFNAGHSNREIDIDWLYQQPHEDQIEHIERFDLENTHFYLLAKGNLLNLASRAGIPGMALFDSYSAVMLLGISWILDRLPTEIQPGLQPYPKALENEIAEMSVRLHSNA